jgi:hypothetical protein
MSGPKPVAQYFHRNGSKLVISPIGIKEIVSHHGVQVGPHEGDSDAMKHQQGRFQIVDDFGPHVVMQ